MTDELRSVEEEALAAIAASESTAALAEADTNFLGRKNGRLTGLMKTLGSLPNEQKPAFGQALNDAKSRVETALADRKAALEAAERLLREQSEAIDVTLPGKLRPVGRLHPLTRTFDDVKQVFLGLGFTFVDGPDVEDYAYNFDWLNYPTDHPAMDEQDTFYVEGPWESQTVGARLLRTHTTGTLQGRTFEHILKNSEPNVPFRMASMGRCFRRDAMDDTHSHTFHQIDGFSVAEGISLADLKGVLGEIARGMFGPESKVRFRPDFFPFVEPGVEVAIWWTNPATGEGRWLELGGAGLIHPNILRRAGFDTERYTGWAFGLGLDRMPMVRFGVSNLRLFLENDPRFLGQF
ncbi:MAG: phenylalanine--tRNA ligase subunit alpha [Armatimonas sp.]